MARLGAVQVQDYPAAQWALGLRLAGASAAALDAAFAAGTILRTHVMRPTWHFVTPADICWLLALTAPRGAHKLTPSIIARPGWTQPYSAHQRHPRHGFSRGPAPDEGGGRCDPPSKRVSPPRANWRRPDHGCTPSWMDHPQCGPAREQGHLCPPGNGGTPGPDAAGDEALAG